MAFPKNSILNPQVCKIEIVATTGVQSVVATSDKNYKIVNLIQDGTIWLVVYNSPGKAIFEEEQQDDPAGPFFNQKLEFPYPGEDFSTRYNLNNLENKRFLVTVTYNSGIRKLLGDLENPCVIRVNFSLEKGGRILSIQRRSSEPSFMI